MSLYINEETMHSFINYSKSQLPQEACGLLVAFSIRNQIDTFIPIINISNSSNTFHFEPTSFIDSLYNIDKKGATWVGVIHSHPSSSAFPSKLDIENWYYPNQSYWIYSSSNNRFNAFYMDKENIQPIEYHII